MTCLIVDDEAPARDELRFFLSKLEGIRVAGEADSVARAFEQIKSLAPDLVFLDIEMPGNSGFFLVEKLKDLARMPHVVFATAFGEYAVKAFEADAVDYLLKPFSLDRVKDAVEKVRARAAAGAPDRDQTVRTMAGLPSFSKLPLEKEGRMILVSPEDIFFFESSGKEITARLEDGVFFLPREATMEKLETRLAASHFFRAHRSFLVNLDKIREFYSWFGGKYELVMKDKASSKIPVSKTRVRAFKEIVSGF